MDADALRKELRAAIDSHIPVRTDHGLPSDYYSWEAGRMALRFWADALVRDIQRVHELLGVCRQCAPPDDETLPLEEAFMRVDAASEKVRAILALSLGVPALVVYGNALYFRPAELWDEVQGRLVELARTDADVGKLVRLHSDLSDATEYRNPVCHSLSAIDHTYLPPFVGV